MMQGHDVARPERAVQRRVADVAPVPAVEVPAEIGDGIEDLTPRQIVDLLDRHIVGQADAKRAVAVALRNRFRRRRVPEALRNEIQPRNILMIGPTGVGKTEIARRVASIMRAPFIKVEATRFTEVGYVGRDVESIIRDLVEVSVAETQRRRFEHVREQAEQWARGRILEMLTDQSLHQRAPGRRMSALNGEGLDDAARERREAQAERRRRSRERRRIEHLLEQRQLEDEEIELDIETDGASDIVPFMEGQDGEPELDMRDMLAEVLEDMHQPRRVRRRVRVGEARRILTNEESSRMVEFDEVVQEAIHRAEVGGVVFIDEIDKTVATDDTANADISASGVQRDLLPMVEGTVVPTRYGPVQTGHMLFIASGAFHQTRPSDLIPELQGRFPVRVELQPLTEDDLFAILSRTDQALARQYEALLATDDVELTFAEDGLRRIAAIAWEVNTRQDDIGARRLMTLMERVLEDVLFDAPEGGIHRVDVTQAYVDEHVGEIADDEDYSLFIL